MSDGLCGVGLMPDRVCRGRTTGRQRAEGRRNRDGRSPTPRRIETNCGWNPYDIALRATQACGAARPNEAKQRRSVVRLIHPTVELMPVSIHAGAGGISRRSGFGSTWMVRHR